MANLDMGKPLTNGLGAHPDWVIVRDGGMWLVGKRDLLGPVLSPVFELTNQVHQADSGGGILLTYGAQPLMLLASIETWRMTPDANVWPVKGCSAEKHIRDAIERAQGMVQSMRAQQAGLVIAREMPKGRAQ